MSRVIKFRAWHSGGFMMEAVTLEEIAANCFDWGDRLLNPAAIKDMTIMQFTGLYDKSGKEIWEGDVIKFKEYIGYDPDEFQETSQQVTFVGGAFSPIFLADWAFHDEDDKPMKIWDVEVIGNIYSNPELLK